MGKILTKKEKVKETLDKCFYGDKIHLIHYQSISIKKIINSKQKRNKEKLIFKTKNNFNVTTEHIWR